MERAAAGPRWWRAVTIVGVAQAVVFAVVAVVDDLGILGQAGIALVGAVLTAWGRILGVAIIGVLSLLEALFVPFYERDTTFDQVTQGIAWLVGVLGVVAVGAVFLERRRGGHDSDGV